MTHEPESGIQPAVVDYFVERYGADRVVAQDHLGSVDWFADVVVDCGWGRLYVEVENDADSVRAGAAQAGAYAGTDPVGGIGLVVAPADHLPRPARLAAIRRLGVLVRAFDVDAGAFVDE